MQTLLLTVAGPGRSIDLEVPGEIALSDLLPALLEICGPPSLDDANRDPAMWEVSYEGAPLQPTHSLIQAEVVAGALLVLQDKKSPVSRPEQRTTFTPKSITPGPATGGIGITWTRDGLSSQ